MAGLKDVYVIVLLGVTGAGKSTFASLASGKNLKISHGVDPCTQEPEAIKFKVGDRSVMLIDTPGFDDDMRSDVEILEEIAKWVAKKGFMDEKLLDGLIFLHPVNLHRVGGSERRRTKLLEQLLGAKAHNRVVIATTMWDDVKEETAEIRLQGRITAGGVWHEMCNRGATLMRHDNNRDSAHKIIRLLIDKADKLGKIEPQFQVELKAAQGHVVQTSAGKELKKQLQSDIKLIKEQLEAHYEERPPERDRRSKSRDQRKEWKEWKKWEKKRAMIEERLQLREQQLNKLQSMIVRLRNILASFLGFR